MVPSPALVAKDLRFIDENVQDATGCEGPRLSGQPFTVEHEAFMNRNSEARQENFIKGRIEFYPPAMGAEAVAWSLAGDHSWMFS